MLTNIVAAAQRNPARIGPRDRGTALVKPQSLILGAIVSATTLAGIGCDQIGNKDRYELKQDKFGRTVRLDKQTGEMAILDGDKLSPALSEGDRKAADDKRQASENAERIRDVTLGTPKLYPPQEYTHLGVKVATVQTMWRDSKLYFQLTMTPAPTKLTPVWGLGDSRFRIVFFDANGFQLISEPIPTTNLARDFDNNGNSPSMSANWSIPLSREAYESIGSWTITWLD